MRRLIGGLGAALMAALLLVPTVLGQETISLRLSRDFGYAAGTQIQGTFSFRVSGPETLERVEFLVDGSVVATDEEAPWRYQFRTEQFELGTHTMSAIGYTSDGRVLEATPIVRQFVTSRNPLLLVGGIVAIIVIGFAVATLITRRSGGYGPLGAAVCANCGRPFGIHMWSINLAARRIDRCPHCGKWQAVQRATPDELAAAEAQLGLVGDTDTSESLSAEDELRRRLDDSRFDDFQ